MKVSLLSATCFLLIILISSDQTCFSASLDSTPLFRTKVKLPKTVSFTFTQAGDLICPITPNSIVKINSLGEKIRIAGNGLVPPPYFSGEDVPAGLAHMFEPQSAVVTSKGELIIADSRNRKIRKVDTKGIISTISGTAASLNVKKLINGQRAFGSALPCIHQVMSVGNEIYFSTSTEVCAVDYFSSDIFKIDQEGLIYHVAGDRDSSMTMKDNKASGTKLKPFLQFAISKDGLSLYIAETSAHVIRKVDLVSNVISTVAGSASYGFSGDKLPAVQAQLYNPSGVAIDSHTHDIYISDSYNNRIRKVDSKTGIITTIAGIDNVVYDKMKGEGFSQDGGYASLSRLDYPTFLQFSPNGDLYVIEKTGYSKLSRCPKGSIPNTKTGKCTVVQKNPFEESADDGNFKIEEWIGGRNENNGRLIKSIRKALKNLRDF